jgi:uncharacterized protein YndB with AHSA1/START domain
VRGEHSVTIHRPADVVFAVIADGSRNAGWRPGVIEVHLRSGDGGVGSEWRQLVHGPGGKSADADYVVTAFRRPHLYGYQGTSGPVRAAAEYTLTEATPGETVVSLGLTLSPRGALRVLTGFVLRQMVDELDSLDRLRDLLSRPSGLSPQPPSS